MKQERERRMHGEDLPLDVLCDPMPDSEAASLATLTCGSRSMGTTPGALSLDLNVDHVPQMYTTDESVRSDICEISCAFTGR